MKHKIVKVLMGIIVISMLFITPMTVKALEGDDYTVPDQGEGTIRLSLVFEDDVDNTRIQIPLKNVEISLYQVWTYEDRLVTLTDAFKDAEVELSGQMSAKDIQDNAIEFSDLKEGAPVYRSGFSDENGYLEFTGLPFGGYLVAQEGEIIQDNAKYISGDFLVTLPYKVDSTGEWVADFTVGAENKDLNTDAAIAPKFALKPIDDIPPETTTVKETEPEKTTPETTTPEITTPDKTPPETIPPKTTKTSKKSPKTGDNMNMSLYICLLGGAIFTIIIVLLGRRKAEK